RLRVQANRIAIYSEQKDLGRPKSGSERKLSKVKADPRGTVEIAIRVMNAVKPPEKRRPVIELVPEVYGVVEQQEPKDDAQRFRHAEPPQETESVPLGQRLHRFD